MASSDYSVKEIKHLTYLLGAGLNVCQAINAAAPCGLDNHEPVIWCKPFIITIITITICDIMPLSSLPSPKRWAITRWWSVASDHHHHYHNLHQHHCHHRHHFDNIQRGGQARDGGSFVSHHCYHHHHHHICCCHHYSHNYHHSARQASTRWW